MDNEENNTGPEAGTPAEGTQQQPTSLLDSQNSGVAEATPESTGEETPEGEPASGEEGQVNPDTYADFTVPEGMTLDSELLASATPLFQELNLTQEQAQRLVDFQAQQVQASSQSQSDNFDRLLAGWQEQARLDSEFGGDAFEENIGIAQQAIEKFGTPELKQLLNDHGVGNHPEMIRLMVRVGKLTQEDVPGDVTAPINTAQSRVDTMYPNDRKS